MLQEVQSRPLPIDHTSQVSFMQVVDALLNSVAQAEFEPAAESTYETQIFPAIFDRLSQRNDIAVIKRLFRMLYDRVRGENAEGGGMTRRSILFACVGGGGGALAAMR